LYAKAPSNQLHLLEDNLLAGQRQVIEATLGVMSGTSMPQSCGQSTPASTTQRFGQVKF